RVTCDGSGSACPSDGYFGDNAPCGSPATISCGGATGDKSMICRSCQSGSCNPLNGFGANCSTYSCGIVINACGVNGQCCAPSATCTFHVSTNDGCPQCCVIDCN